FYLLGLILVYLFCLVVPIFPISGGYSIGTQPRLDPAFVWDLVRHATLPALSLIITGTGLWALSMRAMMVTTEGEDFMTFADAKGLRPRRMFLAHGERDDDGRASRRRTGPPARPHPGRLGRGLLPAQPPARRRPRDPADAAAARPGRLARRQRQERRAAQRAARPRAELGDPARERRPGAQPRGRDGRRTAADAAGRFPGRRDRARDRDPARLPGRLPRRHRRRGHPHGGRHA